MTAIGRRVTLTRLLYTWVVLMSTATGEPTEPTGPTSVTCKFNDAKGWGRFGKDGKDVCSIARELMSGTCQLSFIPHLDESTNAKDRWYTASRFNDDDELRPGKRCACERVMFNLLSACAGCQKWGWSTVNTTSFKWQTFEVYQDHACGNSSTRDKRDIGWNPEPPAWAASFSGEAFDPNFDPTTVQTSAGTSQGPEPTSIFPSAFNPAAETSPITGDVAQATSTSTTPSTGSSSPPIGAIVGGVIGGLILLGAIAGLIFWICRRKRRARDVAPSSEFLKPEYYTTPPLLHAQERIDSIYQDEIEEETRPSPTNRHSWAGGLMATRRHEEDDDCEMLPPFTQGTYIGPSPHEKGFPERRDTADTDITMRTHDTTTFLLPSSSPTRRPGPSDYLT